MTTKGTTHMNEPQASTSCCGGSKPAPAGASDDATGAANDDLTTCPVMVGSPVSKKAAEAAGLFRDHEGQRYYFCCAGCGPAFDADPAKYAANMA